MSWLRCGSGGGPKLEYIGTYSGDQTIDVSDYLKSGDTVDNFIMDFKSIPNAYVGQFNFSDNAAQLIGISTPKTLSGNTLTINGRCRLDYCYNTTTVYMSRYANITYDLYYISKPINQ